MLGCYYSDCLKKKQKKGRDKRPGMKINAEKFVDSRRYLPRVQTLADG